MEEIRQMSLAYIELTTTEPKRAAYVLSDKLGIMNFKILENGIIRIYDASFPVQELSKTLALNDVAVTALGRKNENLENYFLKMTSEGGAHHVEAD